MNESIRKKFLYCDQAIMLGRFDVHNIRAMVKAGHLKEIGALRTCNVMRHLPPKDFMDPSSTNTYDRCLTLELNCNEQLVVEVYEGDMSYGYAVSGRARYTFEGDWTLYEPLLDEVNKIFKQVTMLEICDIEDQERERRRQAYAKRRLEEFDHSKVDE